LGRDEKEKEEEEEVVLGRFLGCCFLELVLGRFLFLVLEFGSLGVSRRF
jgi:hypothetical protein